MSIFRISMRALLAVVVPAVSVAGVSACSSAAPTNGEAGETGSLSMAMTAVGPDGATYTLPAGTTLVLETGADAGSSSVANLNWTPNYQGTQTSDSFSLPPGNYQVLLVLPPGQSAWNLNRAGDGGATSVVAVLASPNPFPVSITAGKTTPITLSFVVNSLGSIAFTTGTLQTNLQVDAGTNVAPTSGVFAGTSSPYGEVIPGSDTAVNTLFNGLTTDALPSFSIPFKLTGPFAMGVDQTCAPASIPSMSATPGADAGTAALSVAALFSELVGAKGTACFYDAVGMPNYSGNVVQLNVTRTGAPLTPTFQSVIGAAATTSVFALYLEGSTDAYGTNGVLTLTPFTQPTSVQSSYADYVLGVQAPGTSRTTVQVASSTMTLQMSP
jgi:hypothetical protein